MKTRGENLFGFRNAQWKGGRWRKEERLIHEFVIYIMSFSKGIQNRGIFWISFLEPGLRSTPALSRTAAARAPTYVNSKLFSSLSQILRGPLSAVSTPDFCKKTLIFQHSWISMRNALISKSQHLVNNFGDFRKGHLKHFCSMSSNVSCSNRLLWTLLSEFHEMP